MEIVIATPAGAGTIHTSIEMAFARHKLLIRRAAARTWNDLWCGAGHVCDILTEKECRNLFKAAGYETD
ncbi:MAG: hypothetical protein IBX58_05540 [Roseovarius sp.]|nr:hypothetical protein [Roseovarius sp.]